jgi:hypothetical protein
MYLFLKISPWVFMDSCGKVNLRCLRPSSGLIFHGCFLGIILFPKRPFEKGGLLQVLLLETFHKLECLKVDLYSLKEANNMMGKPELLLWSKLHTHNYFSMKGVLVLMWCELECTPEAFVLKKLPTPYIIYLASGKIQINQYIIREHWKGSRDAKFALWFLLLSFAFLSLLYIVC